MTYKSPLGFGENRQNQFSSSATWKRSKFEAKRGGLKTSFARKKEERKSVVKYSPINQFIRGFSPSTAVTSYLNGNVEDKQFYFSFGSFSTERSLNLGLESRFNFKACATHWFFLKLNGYNLVKHCAKNWPGKFNLRSRRTFWTWTNFEWNMTHLQNSPTLCCCRNGSLAFPEKKSDVLL